MHIAITLTIESVRGRGWVIKNYAIISYNYII